MTFVTIRRIFTVSLVFALATTVVGCTTNKEVPFAEQAVVIDISAERDLNSFNKRPHTLAVIVYQLSEPNVFNQMLEDPEGVSVLLQGEAFDSSVKSRRRVVIQPGEKRVLTMDRAADTRYLGVVAGYYNQRTGNFSRLHPVKLRQILLWTLGGTKTNVTLRLGKDGILSE